MKNPDICIWYCQCRKSKGDPIAVLDAMKMENTLPSPSDGQVTSTPVNTGDTVIKGDILAVIS